MVLYIKKGIFGKWFPITMLLASNTVWHLRLGDQEVAPCKIGKYGTYSWLLDSRKAVDCHLSGADGTVCWTTCDPLSDHVQEKTQHIHLEKRYPSGSKFVEVLQLNGHNREDPELHFSWKCLVFLGDIEREKSNKMQTNVAGIQSEKYRSDTFILQSRFSSMGYLLHVFLVCTHLGKWLGIPSQFQFCDIHFHNPFSPSMF